VDQVNNPKLWPTPTASDRFNANMKNDHDIKRGYLRGVVKVRGNDYTLWPTPTAVDYKGARKPETMKKTGRNPMTNSLSDAAAHTNPEQEGQLSGSLNPTWVEWLMGYPEGWTELEA